MKNKVLIIGAARSGIAVAKLLHRHNYDVVITDQNKIKEKKMLEALGITVYDQGHPEVLYAIDWTFIVKNPGIPYKVPFVSYFVKKQVKIYTEIEIGYWFAKKFHYAAVTGTNGKTTITTVLYEMLKKNKNALVAGNIGYPLSEVVLEHELEEKNVAIELSNFQLLGIETFAPTVSTVCNLAPDHLDYMESLESYYISKMKIYENCKEDAWFIRNVDDEVLFQYAKNIPCRCIDISMKHKNCDVYREQGKIMFHDICLFLENDVKIPGEYNLMNLSMSAIMAYRMGVSIENIQETIRNFYGIEHRMEYVAEYHQVRFYNDSKATNSHALQAALQAFEGNIILLAGGHDKGISFDDLNIYNHKVKICCAFGQTKNKFQSVFTNVILCDDMKQAFEQAIHLAKPNDIVLLSPGCSSYDQFKNYEERGLIFKQFVKEYIDKGEHIC